MIKRGCLNSILLTAALLAFGCGLPPIPPGPTPDPINPVVISPDLHVLIVRETADQGTLSAEQSAIFTSVSLRKTIRDAKGRMKIWDDEVDVANESDATFRRMLELPRSSLPWIVIATKTNTVSQPLPKTVDATEALIAGTK